MCYVIEREKQSRFFKCQNQCIIWHLIRGSSLLFCCHQSAFLAGWRGGCFSSLCSLSCPMLSKNKPSNISKALLPTSSGCLLPWDTMGRANNCETSRLIWKNTSNQYWWVEQFTYHPEIQMWNRAWLKQNVICEILLLQSIELYKKIGGLLFLLSGVGK